jgi:hypothetical protein
MVCGAGAACKHDGHFHAREIRWLRHVKDNRARNPLRGLQVTLTCINGSPSTLIGTRAHSFWASDRTGGGCVDG